jgi:hypothetical protein
MPIRRKKADPEAPRAPRRRKGATPEAPADKVVDAVEVPTSDERYAEAAHTIRDHDEEW